MLKTRTVFYPDHDQSSRIAALSSYARSCGCRIYVDRSLNRPLGTKIVTVTGPLWQIWKMMLFSRFYARGMTGRPFRIGEVTV